MKAADRPKLLIGLAIAAVALFAGDKLIYSPLTNLWDKRTKEISELRRKITEASAMIRQEEVYQRRWSEMKTNALPDSQSVALERISKAFHAWEEESRVSLDVVSP